MPNSRFCSNVVFVTLAAAVVMMPGAAMQTNQFRKSRSAPAKETACEKEPDVEFYLDALSWKLYQERHFSTVGNLSLPGVHGHSKDQRNLNNVAAARVTRFVEAAKGYSLNTTKENAFATGGARNHATQDEHMENAYCCHHVPDDDPYWQETERYDQTHPGYLKCQYSDGCTKKVTNTMRVESIRRSLKGSKKLFDTLGVQSLLYGGSALGQMRCGDVIPWDIDCDFMLDQASIEVIHEKVFGVQADFSNWEEGETSQDLAAFGAPGLRLIKKTPCCPFEVVDTEVGFFCDVFTSKWYETQLYTPWWSGDRPCPGLFKSCDAIGGGQKCYAFVGNVISPAHNCVMSGVEQSCPPDMTTYLQTLYGYNFQTPNQTINAGA